MATMDGAAPNQQQENEMTKSHLAKVKKTVPIALAAAGLKNNVVIYDITNDLLEIKGEQNETQINAFRAVWRSAFEKPQKLIVWNPTTGEWND